ncbi:hypothetical protein WA588_005445, partial [Blastocystis sp. NMH]
FFGCKTCLLDHLPSLRTLVFEACCFSAVHHFVLSNLDSLQMIQLNRSSCSSCVSIRFESLPKLQSLVLGEYALAEDSDKLSTLVMKSCDQLSDPPWIFPPSPIWMRLVSTSVTSSR